MDADSAKRLSVPKVLDATLNPPRTELDLYTPRFVKGRGTSKVRPLPVIIHRAV